MTLESARVPDAGVLEELFPYGAEAICRYVDLLTSTGIERGLLGPREAARMWPRHILNCAVVAPAFRPDQTVCDLGSGAGLPGIVLALARPDLQLTLLEPLLRRSRFLEEVVEDLGLPNAVVLRARAEDVAGTVKVDAVTARAVAPLERLAAWALPLLVAGGELVAIKGAGADEEIAKVRPALTKLGVTHVRLEAYGHKLVDPPTQVVRLESRR
jgi:16S rRNA (guanine527-N7)-methyltransferase